MRFLFTFLSAALLAFGSVSGHAQTAVSADDDAMNTYTIKFAGKSVAAALGPMRRADHTHRRNAAGRLVLDTRAPASQRYLDSLRTKQDAQIEVIEDLLGRDLPIQYRFDVVVNGVAVEMTEAEARRVAEVPGVEWVTLEPIYQLDTYAGPQSIGADAIWEGTSTVSGIGNRGEGMIAGVIDSGINTQAHPSFSATDADGYVHTNPFGDGVFLGDCIGGTNGTNQVQCNNKLIGAYTYVGGTPEDTQAAAGHGSHTASTMAGNLVFGPVTTNDGTVIPVDQISGVAPRANLIAYRGCGDTGCPGAATSAALQQALIDGVNATNFSIGPTVGGRNISPWQSSSNVAMLDLVAAGIFTAASAGNTRDGTNNNPEADVANKGPWIATVANSTHGGFIAHDAAFEEGGVPAGGLESVLALPGTGPALTSDLEEPVFWAQAEDAANFEGCNAWTGSPFTGGILLVSRGSCGFVDKVNNAQAAGAVGVIVYNNVDGPPITMGGLEATTIPSVMVPRDTGLAAGAFINGATSPTAFIPGAVSVVFEEQYGKILNAGSLKGPNLDFDVTEPDINAPGTSILAATATGAAGEWRFLTGTSMSGPHIAGAGLLLMAEHPEWSPSEILSALMMTADPVGTLTDGTPTGPDDVGSGTADLTKASLSGLVMHIGYDDFLAADPAAGGDVRTLNLPSMRNTSCNPTCSWTRTVRNATDADATWIAAASSSPAFDVSVSPTTFEVLGGDVIFRDDVENFSGPNSSYQQLEITVTNNTAGAQMEFGELILSHDGGTAPDARMTIAVSQSLPAAPPI
jgi:hypothetical protein